jgi:hypothetical protein
MKYTLHKDFLFVSNKRGAFGISNNVGKAFDFSFFYTIQTMFELTFFEMDLLEYAKNIK